MHCFFTHSRMFYSVEFKYRFQDLIKFNTKKMIIHSNLSQSDDKNVCKQEEKKCEWKSRRHRNGKYDFMIYS